MPRRILLYFLFLLTPLLLYSETEAQVKQESFFQHYEYLSQLHPRWEGSYLEQDALSYIITHVNSLGLDYSTDTLSDAEGSHSFSTSLRVLIEGQREDTLLIAVPLSGPRQSDPGQDGAVNLALALDLMEIYSQNKPELTLHFLFLGAEDGEGREYPKGSRYFLSDFFPKAPTALLYLNLADIPRRLTIETGGSGIVSPYWLIKESTQALREADLYFLIKGNETQVLRLDLPSGYNNISPYLQEEIPGILMVSGELREEDPRNREEWVQAFYQFFDNFLSNNTQGLQQAWDLHYLFFQVWENFFLLTETNLLLLILGTLGLFILLSGIFRNRVRNRLGKLLLRVWNFPLLFVLLFTFLFLATRLLGWAIEIRSFPAIWTYIPLFFLWLKIAASAFLFLLFFALIKHLPISRSPSLYSGAAFMIFTILFVVALSRNLSFSYYPLWAQAMTLVFIFSPRREIKLLAMSLSPVWFIKAAVDIFSIPEMTIVQGLLLSPIRGNLILTLIIFPFALLILSYHFIPHTHPVRGNQYLSLIGTTVSGTASLLIFLYILNFTPFSPENKQPLKVHTQADMNTENHQMVITTPLPVENLKFSVAGQDFLLPTLKDQSRHQLPFSPDLLLVDSFSSQFLDRKQSEVVIFPGGEPWKIRLEILGEDFVVYDLNFPFESFPADNKAVVYIGANPPVPLILDLTTNREAQVELDITILYDKLPYPFRLEDPSFSVEEQMEIHTKYPIP